jgi:hypothetical protein
MKRSLVAGAAGLALALPLSLAVAAPAAAAAKPADPGKGGRCIAAGLATLNSLGAVPEAAKGTLDYGPYVGPDGIRLGDGPTTDVFLPLSTVISLHRTSPSTFAWCDNV